MKFANRKLFLIIGLVVLVVFGFGGYQLGRFFLREPTANTVANKKLQKDSKVKTSLGNFSELEGTPYLMAPVNSQLNYRQDYSENKQFTIRNYLFVNVNDKSTQQLVPKNDFLFVNAQKVVLERRDDKIVRGIWYEVVKADSNNDKRLDNNDKITIAVSDVSGSDYTEVIDEVDRFLGSHQKNSTTLLVFYELDGREYIGEIDMLKRVLVEKVVLPAIR
ncbi:hypothetical protein [Calothrix sp. CCY 0018]|uniref:hypothetical protein n=1 Tax=Calothrix sp. CCY 0018 TaxID=3103864 RepID=UPI0039C73CB7